METDNDAPLVSPAQTHTVAVKKQCCICNLLIASKAFAKHSKKCAEELEQQEKEGQKKEKVKTKCKFCEKAFYSALKLAGHVKKKHVSEWVRVWRLVLLQIRIWSERVECAIYEQLNNILEP